MKGVNVYINTFDGCAATTEDFIYSVVKGAYSDEENCLFDIKKFSIPVLKIIKFIIVEKLKFTNRSKIKLYLKSLKLDVKYFGFPATIA